MGLSLSSLLLSLWEDVFAQKILGHTFSFKNLDDDQFTPTSGNLFDTLDGRVSNKAKDAVQKTGDDDKTNNTISLMDGNRPEKMVFQRSLSFKDMLVEAEAKGRAKNGLNHMAMPTISLPQPPAFSFSPRPVSELDAAAVTLQKVYKSYRTRRNLADCAVVVEELWWRALDFVELRRNSVSFFDSEKPETAVSRWARVRNMAAKVGKGLSKDDKAQKLALQHWLEAIDPRHRYGHNLHFYYDIWFESESAQPFFYWLDVGDGKKINLPNCPRPNLQRQCIKYLGPKERESYEVIVVLGRLMYKKCGTYVETEEGSKWIFVLSTSRCLYVGQKKKGLFQHSSFLAGGATTAAGRLVAHDGVLEAIWPYSGHYLPTEENFREFISFLKEHNVDLTNVKRYSINDDSKSFLIGEDTNQEQTDGNSTHPPNADAKSFTQSDSNENENVLNKDFQTGPMFDVSKRLSCKWTTGTGPRIGCVRDYPTELQFKALEQVKLSPRNGSSEFASFGPIPSPRPSPKLRLSPRLAYMGLPSPTSVVT